MTTLWPDADLSWALFLAPARFICSDSLAFLPCHNPAPQFCPPPFFGGSGAPCQGPADARGGRDVPGHQKPSRPHPEEELLCWRPAVVCGDPSQRDGDFQAGQLRAVLGRRPGERARP